MSKFCEFYVELVGRSRVVGVAVGRMGVHDVPVWELRSDLSEPVQQNSTLERASGPVPRGRAWLGGRASYRYECDDRKGRAPAKGPDVLRG